MKKHFIVSLVKNGIIGGSIVADSESMAYHTSKLTIPHEYRYIVMKYENISEITKGWLFILPTVTVKMQSGKSYQFVVFFSRQHFINALKKLGMKEQL